ncbi:hypothetical protein [Thermaerobacter subterraneus]|uniref:Uncharacterized protein n=1 Tax=Thermaerobacter subterraneus DSM 13965 TaxID=867903 RepID=K6PZI4_9FIRM|nr:hypothetical protein [Thermaerobacter subterraneus]EKP94218.1 hypothetical protein ThesuDRAFT_01948 [Thermaerobacter subterraneus DSM 13965]
MANRAGGNGQDRSPRRPATPRPAGGERAAAEPRRAGVPAAGGIGGREAGAARGAAGAGAAGGAAGAGAAGGAAGGEAAGRGGGGDQPRTPESGGRRRMVPQPLRARPIGLRAARAGGRPTGPIPLPAYQLEGAGADGTPGPGRAGANRTGSMGTSGPGAGGGTGGGVAGETGTVTGPGPNQKDDIRQSLWVRRPDLFYGKPNRGSHRAAFAEPLAPEREQLQAPSDPAALRREGVERVPAARELLPLGEQGAPAAAGYLPARPSEGRVDRQVARQLTQRPSPSSQGKPVARTRPAGVAAGTVRWEAAGEPGEGMTGPVPAQAGPGAPAAGRGDPAADVTAPARAPAAAGPGDGAEREPAPGDGPAGPGEPAGSSETGPAAMVQEVGGAPVPLTPEAALAAATGPNAAGSVRENLGATLQAWAGHEVAPRSQVAGGQPAGNPEARPAAASPGAGGQEQGGGGQDRAGEAPLGDAAGGHRLEAAAELRPRPRLTATLRPRSFPQGKAAAGIYGRPPGDRSTDATALTRGAIRAARERWESRDGGGEGGQEGRTP